ncbi:hypothetical protein Golomagni_07473 [Golovinomyces magnicellulatus]|nr:hypothetical protein Golomagni_07473 [Golovinomyces magnicellulatus]
MLLKHWFSSSLPLILAEEFLAQHPEHSNADENELMYARIEHERAERETLESRRQELLKRKQKLIAENTRRKDDLANLDQDLEKFIDYNRLPNQFWNSLKKLLEEIIHYETTEMEQWESSLAVLLYEQLPT